MSFDIVEDVLVSDYSSERAGNAVLKYLFGNHPRAISMGIPKGWLPLVTLLLLNIKEDFPDAEFTQVKIKFGYLTVYYTAPSLARPDIDRRILRVGNRLREVCSICSGSKDWSRIRHCSACASRWE